MNQADWPGAWTAQIGEGVRDIRKAQGLSANELSDKTADLGVRIPRNTIANLENGRKQSIPIHELQLLASALGVPFSTLACYPDERATTPYLPGCRRSVGAVYSEQYMGNGSGNHYGEDKWAPPRAMTLLSAVDLQAYLGDWEQAHKELESVNRSKTGLRGGQRAHWEVRASNLRQQMADIEDTVRSILEVSPELAESAELLPELSARLTAPDA